MYLDAGFTKLPVLSLKIKCCSGMAEEVLHKHLQINFDMTKALKVHELFVDRRVVTEHLCLTVLGVYRPFVISRFVISKFTCIENSE